METYIRVKNGRCYALRVRWTGPTKFYSLDGDRWYLSPEQAVVDSWLRKVA